VADSDTIIPAAPMRGAVALRDWTSNPLDGNNVRGYVGVITFLTAKEALGHDVNDRDSNWLLKVEGETDVTVFIMGCDVRHVWYLPGINADEVVNKDFYVLP
jgi:hypothetical protein